MSRSPYEPKLAGPVLTSWALSRGITPARIELAYKYSTARDLCRVFELAGRDLTALANRWGVARNRYRKTDQL